MRNVLKANWYHQAIAQAIGTTRVTLTRLLNEFERAGIIKSA